MLQVTQSKQFERDYKKLPLHIQQKFDTRLYLFLSNPMNPLLNKHCLHGKYKKYFSINITGDYRAIFSYLSENQIEFQRIGTHSQLYK